MASDNPPQPDLLSNALASASSLVLLQFFSRVFTFILNQALVRYVSPQVFGTAAIQFELLLSTILFLSREGVRNALLRSSASSVARSSNKDSQSLVANITILPTLLGIPAAILIAFLYVASTSASTASQPHFHLSVAIYAVAASLELLSEPLYIRAQNELRFNLRVRAEGIAVVMKTTVAFAVLVIGDAEWALVAFALGQAAFGLAVLSTYLHAYGQGIGLWPKKITSEVHGNVSSKYFDPSLLSLSAAMTGQSVVKHFLTEGDKFLVSRLSPLADQGGYAVASNYGSLVARMVFQPIEETSRVFFSKSLTDQKQDPAALRSAANVLLALLLLFTHLLLLLVTFGPPYLPLALAIVLPPKYLHTSAPTILRTYIYYIPMMAFNGVLEAFFASAAAPADLHRQSRWLFAFSLGFVAVAVGLAKGAELGDAGLVWANVVNLLCRALYAWRFALRFFRERSGQSLVGWRTVVPPVPVLVVFACAAGATRWSERVFADVPLRLTHQVGHIATAVCCLAGCLLACFVFERRTFVQLFSSLRKR
ncbi:Rft-1-domain-containing protein [Rhodofomes roseus]|uniref:Man(5)GlcNAc(2)-PP-dolichol translocation protein RFT1 n=1 Tax=Rhodofomes roseus TaxID=34475 RepID=A0ABQ8KRZ3_9APHY|nr:Rft-1-domain-containing protein [Rhodofomes roseus]KAH9841349.1 Rft-1-domain-containing protein [Rhodofomes roseus]